MTQPSPIGGKNSDREEDDDFLNFCKNRPHENGGQGNNAGSNKMTSDAGAIFRSVTADDDNAPVANDGNADFSTAILMGNLSASNSNQVKRVAGPVGWVSNAMQGGVRPSECEASCSTLSRPDENAYRRCPSPNVFSCCSAAKGTHLAHSIDADHFTFETAVCSFQTESFDKGYNCCW